MTTQAAAKPATAPASSTTALPPAPAPTPASKGSLKSREAIMASGAAAHAVAPRLAPALTPLQTAALRGNVAALTAALTASKSELETADAQGNTLILLVARSGSVEAFKVVASAGAKIDATNSAGHNALHISVLKGQTLLATYIATTYKELDKGDANGNSPIHLTVEPDDKATCQALLDAGCDPSSIAKHGRTPLQLAAEKGKVGVAGLLVTRPALLEGRGHTGFTPFHLAAYGGHVPVCAQLKAAGAKGDATDASGYMPIHYTVTQKKRDALAWFITNYPALVATPNGKGKTPLALANQLSWAEGITLLKEAMPHGGGSNGSSPGNSKSDPASATPGKSNAKSNGRSPTTPGAAGHARAVSAGAPGSALKRPVVMGSGRGAPSPRTSAPGGFALNELQKALKTGEDAAVRTAAHKYKALLEVKDASGLTPLLWAVTNRKLSLCKILLNATARADATDPRKQNALHLAVRTGDEDFVNLFLKKGLGEARDIDENTPLLLGLHLSTPSICRALIKDGASPLATNKFGLSTLHVAAQRSDPAFIEPFALFPKLLVAKDAEGNPPFLLAAKRGSPATCLAFIDLHSAAKAPLDGVNLAGQNVLHMGAQNLEENTIAPFILLPKLIEQIDVQGQTPLVTAACAGNLNACKALVVANANIKVVCKGKSLLDLSKDRAIFAYFQPLLVSAGSVSAGAQFQTPAAAGRVADAFRTPTTAITGGSSAATAAGRLLFATPAAGIGPGTLDTPVHSRVPATPSGAAGAGQALINALGAPLDAPLPLLPRKMDVKEASNKGQNEWHVAAKAGDTAALERLLKDKNVANDEADAAGYTPFLLACLHGQDKACKMLLDAGASDTKCATGGKTGLHLAAINGHVAVVRLLAPRKAILDAQDESGSTALILGARYNRPDVCQVLAENQADPLKSVEPSKRTALHIAAQLGYMQVVEVLVKIPGLLKVEDTAGETPLHRAAFGGHLQLCKLFVQCGADVTAKDKKGRTVLHTAASVGETLIVSEFAINPNLRDVQDVEGNTPLMLASEGGHLRALECLITNQASLILTNRVGHNAMHMAVLKTRAMVVTQLANFRDLLNSLDKGENTPLILAAGINSPELCIILIRAGADKNASNASGDTAQLVAKAAGAEAAAKVLSV